MLLSWFYRRERKSARRGGARKGDSQRVIRRFFRLLARMERTEHGVYADTKPARRKEAQI